MRQLEEEDDTQATCPEDSNLTTLNVNCRGLNGREDGINGIPGENGIPGVIGGLECNNHNMLMKGKTNSSSTSINTTTGTIHSGPPAILPTTPTSTTTVTNTTTTTNMRKTKRSPNERRFKCDQCERMFFTRKDVKRHLVVHTGVRNYACPFCQQRFGRKDHLVRHAKKSHQKDTRASAASTANITVSSPPIGTTTNNNNNSPINHHHHRRLTFTHSQVHHGLSGTPTINHHHPGRMIVNVNNNLHNNNNNNNNNTNGSGNNANLSPCNYSSSNLGPVMDQPSSIMLLGPGPGGNVNGTGSSNSNVSSSLNNCSTNGTINGCNTVNGNGVINNNHHDLCYPGNTNHHNGSMASSINDGHFGAPTPMGHHSSLCETTSLFNNGSHYFSLGAGPTPFMNPAYITNCFGHITVNPNNSSSQGLTSVPTMCSNDQTNSVSCTNALTHLDVNLSNHLHHFNQVFQ
ncbi:GATA zinc finger domain-containing protein 14-like [Panonychus citri]|uniref:GATA zinc finger domain-containing protein 14-like n=1 Tax=Panonychus citri TaxID=50023 RepID=UPI0023080AED|nr:GATA zinc finger domain-containing protein 14-like [Panonychus citri]XP_053201485.1 GATA zinc finger domain-containing protein 14-like [Panonychus citri]XP_053201486.1 GATA zinc finger domain-containing protein 14-like [Panonychus citri]XP_053201487.1 GATA zinc finger domain-containing protein 14-like [Panonychus citri]